MKSILQQASSNKEAKNENNLKGQRNSFEKESSDKANNSSEHSEKDAI